MHVPSRVILRYVVYFFFPLHLRKELLVYAGYCVVARGGIVRRRVPCITMEDDKAYNNP